MTKAIQRLVDAGNELHDFIQNEYNPAPTTTVEQALLDALPDLEAVLNPWRPISEAEMDAYEGRCWIVYNGQVFEAYRNHEYRFLFSEHSANHYMTKCISHYMHWFCPIPPEQED